MNENLDSKFIKELEDASKCDPMSVVGTEINMNGHKYEVLGIIGSGALKIVFRVRDKDDPHRKLTLQTERSMFDPRSRLKELMNRELRREGGFDAHKVIAVGERLHLLCPGDEAVAFNCGIAHLSLKQYDRALAHFDIAIANAPRDVWNWLHKAACLAETGHDGECLTCMEVISKLDPDGTRTGLAEAEHLREQISVAVKRIINSGSRGNPVAVQLNQEFLIRSALPRTSSVELKRSRPRGTGSIYDRMSKDELDELIDYTINRWNNPSYPQNNDFEQLTNELITTPRPDIPPPMSMSKIREFRHLWTPLPSNVLLAIHTAMKPELRLLHRVGSIVAELHKKRILHNDLCFRNIHVNGDNPVVCDFDRALLLTRDANPSECASDIGPLLADLNRYSWAWFRLGYISAWKDRGSQVIALIEG